MSFLSRVGVQHIFTIINDYRFKLGSSKIVTLIIIYENAKANLKCMEARRYGRS